MNMLNTVETFPISAPRTVLLSIETEAAQTINEDPSNLSTPKIDTLPTELLLEIFSFVIYGNKSHRKQSSAPMTLAGVCRHWREVVVGAITLWTTISLCSLYEQSKIERASLGLSLSGLRPVDIHFDLRSRPSNRKNDSPRKQAIEMENLLLRVGCQGIYRRWRTMEIKTATRNLLHVFLDKTSSITKLPMLERLELSWCNSYSGLRATIFHLGGPSQPMKLFGGRAYTPKLRHVTLLGVFMDWTSAPNVLKNLTVLELGYMTGAAIPTLDEFLSVMRASPNLEEIVLLACALNITADALPSSLPNMCLFLPHLRKFKLGRVDVEQAVELLWIFQLPALEELCLDEIPALLLSDIEDASPVLETLIQFDLASGIRDPASCTHPFYSLSRVRKFTMRSLHVDDGTYLRFLEKIRNVEQTEIIQDADIDWSKMIDGTL